MNRKLLLEIQTSLEIKIFYNIIIVFILLHLDQFNAFLLNNSINFLQKKKKETFLHTVCNSQ